MCERVCVSVRVCKCACVRVCACVPPPPTPLGPIPPPNTRVPQTVSTLTGHADHQPEPGRQRLGETAAAGKLGSRRRPALRKLSPARALGAASLCQSAAPPTDPQQPRRGRRATARARPAPFAPPATTPRRPERAPAQSGVPARACFLTPSRASFDKPKTLCAQLSHKERQFFFFRPLSPSLPPAKRC